MTTLVTSVSIGLAPDSYAVTSVGVDGVKQAQPLCGVLHGDQTFASASVAAPKELLSRRGIAGFVAVAGKIYAMDQSNQRLLTLNLDGGVLGSTSVSVGPFTVDPTGASYTAEANYDLVKRDGSGQELWRSHQPNPIASIAGVPGAPWRLVAVLRDRVAEIDPATGSTIGARPGVIGSTFAGDAASGLISMDGHFVRQYDASLAEVKRFGSPADANAPMPDGSPLHFHILGGATQLADGRFLVTDSGRGIWLLDANGVALGLAPEARLGLIPQNASIAVVGDTVVYVLGSPWSGNQSIGTLPLADVLRLATSQPMTTGARLGFGAGLSTGVSGNWFRPGVAPHVVTAFDAAWKQVAGLSISYAVRDADQVTNRTDVARKTISLTADAIDTGRALELPVAKPGAYEVDVQMSVGDQAVSATCLRYTVGAQGMDLDLDGLPGGADAGGPTGPRGIALADNFGLGASRLALDWRKLLDGKGNTDFSTYDAEIQAAAAEAQRRHVLLSVQLGSGGPERAFVDNGTWGARVQQVVAHFAPYVDYWEAWNEPNISYGTGTDYVAKILHPFSQAVLAADPTAQRIGGTVVGIGSVPYWQEIVKAGGLADMDIAAIHPYPGHNRSFEEEGFLSKVAQTKAIIAAGGKPDMPMWITEFAFWSNGPGNWFSQADKSVRARILSQSLGINNWEYFLAQGTWGNDGVSFSAIEGNEVVKPVAVALMAAKNELQGRAFQGWVDSGVPHGYIARYGPRSGGNDSVLAAWSDDAVIPVALAGPAGTQTSITDEYGNSTPVQFGTGPAALTLAGAVQYVHEPAGILLSVTAQETWGANLALASNGSVASSSTQGKWNLADKAIDGVSAALGQGDFRSSSAWASAPGDATPSLTVTFPATTTVDRVVVSTGGLGSVQPGIRDADVSVQGSDGTWMPVGQVRNAFAVRTDIVAFPATSAKAVRLTVRSVNLGGYNGGAAPWFWPADAASLQDETQPWYGPAIVRELEAYAPGAVTQTQALTSSPTAAPQTTPGTVATPSPADSPIPAPMAPEPAAALSNPPIISLPVDTPGAAPVASLPAIPPGTASGVAPPTIPGSTVIAAAPTPPSTTLPVVAGTRLSGPLSVGSPAGRPVRRAATLRRDNGTPLASEQVRLMVRRHGRGAWTAFGTTWTNWSGTASFTLTPRINMDLRFIYTGNAIYAGSQSSSSAVMISRLVTVRVGPRVVSRGRDVLLQGTVSPTATGSVYVQRLVGQRWQNVRQIGLISGAYRYKFRVSSAGRYILRVYRPGDATSVASASPQLSIRAT